MDNSLVTKISESDKTDMIQTDDYYYDAFISYKRVEPDQSIAKYLHRQLENFKLPRNIVTKLKSENSDARTRIKRVFRDQEELPLTNDLGEQLKSALERSRWLIIVCSPEYMSSQWCKLELDYFISLRGPEYVLIVLANGRSYEAIPEMFRSDSQTLGANYRHIPNQKWKKQVKVEFLRLVAPMFGLEFDDLKQRHREQTLKKRLIIASAAAFAGIAIGAYASFNVIRLNQKNEALLRNQALFLAKQSEEFLNSQNRENAILSAYQALTEYEGNTMPYTDEAKAALLNAIDPYDNTIGQYSIASKVETDGIITDVQISPSGNTVMLVDDTNTLTFISTKNYSKIGQTEVPASSGYKNNLIYANHLLVDDERVFFIEDNAILSYSINTSTVDSEPIWKDLYDIDALKYDVFTDCLFIITDYDFSIIDMNTGEYLFNGDMESILSHDYDAEAFELINVLPLLNVGKVALNIYNDDLGYCCLIWDYKTASLLSEITYSKDDSQHYPLLIDALVSDGRVFTLVSYICKNENSTDSKGSSIFSCYSASDSKLLWKEKIPNTVSNDVINHRIDVLDNTYGQTVLLINQYAISEYDIETGENLSNASSDFIVNIGHAELNNPDYPGLKEAIHFTNEYGKSFVYIDGMATGISDVFLYNLSSQLKICKDIFFSDGSEPEILVIPNKSNSCLFYSTGIKSSLANDFEPYSSAINAAYCDVYINKEGSDAALKKAIELGIEHPNLVSVIVFNTTNDMFCVSYKTLDVEIYEYESTKPKRLCSFTNKDITNPVTAYCGTDNEGNTYWASFCYGYCISKQGVLLNTIDSLSAIESETNKLIITRNSVEGKQALACPIYTTADLIRIADESLSYRGISH